MNVPHRHILTFNTAIVDVAKPQGSTNTDLKRMEKHENMKGDMKSLKCKATNQENCNLRQDSNKTETCHQTKTNCISDWHTVILNMMTVELEAPPSS